MPASEIPADLRDSSSDSSLSSEPAADQQHAVPFTHRRLASPAAARVRIHVEAVPQQQLAPLRRAISSYDRDLAELEEDNHWPAQAYLLPVVLPQVTEPTLDELLRRVTGQTELHLVDRVKLRVISYMVSLSRLSLFMPRLAQLDLSGSVLQSLRDLGCGLLHLTQLNVSNCGLSSFDGTSGLPSVQVLIADGNMVQLVGPLADLPLLRRLSARNNRIGDLATLTFLGMCPNLEELELQGNPVTNFILYRMTLQRSVRSLKLLDGASLDDALTLVPNAQPALNSSTEQDSSLSSASSLSSEAYVSSTSSEELPVAAARPTTSTGVAGELINVLRSVQQQSRPHSALALASSPIVGSVLDAARRRKRHVWVAAGSSSSDTSSASSFPLVCDGSTRQAATIAGLSSGVMQLPPLRAAARLPRQRNIDDSLSSLSSMEDSISN